jgi:hypothetical protein
LISDFTRGWLVYVRFTPAKQIRWCYLALCSTESMQNYSVGIHAFPIHVVCKYILNHLFTRTFLIVSLPTDNECLSSKRNFNVVCSSLLTCCTYCWIIFGLVVGTSTGEKCQVHGSFSHLLVLQLTKVFTRSLTSFQQS